MFDKNEMHTDLPVSGMQPLTSPGSSVDRVSTSGNGRAWDQSRAATYQSKRISNDQELKQSDPTKSFKMVLAAPRLALTYGIELELVDPVLG